VKPPSHVPPLQRRTISISVLLAAALVSLAFAPLLFTVAALADLVTGPHRWRNCRILAMVMWAIGIEIAGVLICAGLWLRFGCGRRLSSEESFWQHHRLQRWYASALLSAARITCNLRIDVEDPSPASTGNAIVLGRHTSIGDAMIPAVLIAGRFNINTRYVLKDDLLWGPAFDLAGQRLRNHFVDRAPNDSAAERAAVQQLVEGLDERSVAVIFPEGTFFTPARKERSIARLRDLGYLEHARRAAGFRYLLPPRPGGALALLAGAPQADVIIMGNIGLEKFTSLAAIYRSVPFREPVRVWLWRVPNREIPREPTEQLAWLYDEWERLDASIESRMNRGPS